MVTVKEVAELSGVSVSTVSHVVNGTRFVSEGLKNRVLSAMEQLHYRPNRLAKSLRSKHTSSLGLLIADITNPYYSEMAWNIEYLCYLQNYSVMLCNSDGSPSKEEFYINRLMEWQVDGIIIISPAVLPARINGLLTMDLPVILIDSDSQDYGLDSVSVDNFSGGVMAANHLISLGHKRIACINGARENVTNNERVNGFRSAMEAAGLDVDEDLIVTSDFEVVCGMQNALKLLDNETPPTAIFACDDLMAYGAVQAVYSKGLKVPQDLSVVGFDDIYLSKYTVPPLTTIKQPLYELSEEAVNCFFDRMENPDRLARKIRLDLQLEIRGSTAPLM